MTAESNARSHASAFRWWLGNPDLSEEEARLHDLLALHSATEELIREQRDLLNCYDTDADLFGPNKAAAMSMSDRRKSPPE